MNTKTSNSKGFNLWNRIPIVIRAVVIGLFTAIIGITVWTIDFTYIPAPWSLLIMIFVLWAYVNTLVVVGYQS
jgi:hypothetical protein